MNPHKVPVTRSRSRVKYTDPKSKLPVGGVAPDAVVSPSRLVLNPETKVSRCSFIFHLRDSPQTLCFDFLPQCLLVQINSFSKTPNVKWKKQNKQTTITTAKKQNKQKNDKTTPKLKYTDGAEGSGADFVERTTEIVLLYLVMSSALIVCSFFSLFNLFLIWSS